MLILMRVHRVTVHLRVSHFTTTTTEPRRLHQCQGVILMIRGCCWWWSGSGRTHLRRTPLPVRTGDHGNGERGRNRTGWSQTGAEIGASPTLQVLRSGSRRVWSREHRVTKGALEFHRFGQTRVWVPNQNGFQMRPVPGTFALDRFGSNRDETIVAFVNGFGGDFVGGRRERVGGGGVGGSHCCCCCCYGQKGVWIGAQNWVFWVSEMKGQNGVVLWWWWGCGEGGVTIVGLGFVLEHLAIKGDSPTATNTEGRRQRKGRRRRRRRRKRECKVFDELSMWRRKYNMEHGK